MPNTIDELKIQVDADSRAAANGLDSLIESLKTLKTVTGKGITGLRSISSNLETLSAATQRINSSGMRTAASSLVKMAEGMRALSGVSVKGMKTSATQLEHLVAPANSIAGLSGNNFELNAKHIADGLNALSATGKLNVNRTVNQLNSLQAVTQRISASSGAGFESSAKRIADGMIALGAATKLNLNGSINQLSRLPAVVNSISATGMDSFVSSMHKIASALNELSGVGKINLAGTLNQLARLPEIAAALEKVNFYSFTRSIKSLGAAFSTLPTSTDRTRVSLGKLPAAFNRVSAAATKNHSVIGKTRNGYDKLSILASRIKNIGTITGVFYGLYSSLSACYEVSNDFAETLNMFEVEMGDAAQAAKAYAEEVNAALGIDIAEWMKNQGNMQQIVTGFGVASDAATIMSQNLTQLGYDIASFFNATDITQPFDRIRSAMAGETEGMRQYGVDMTVASMQSYMLTKGIDAQWNSLDQASKAMIRYNYMIEKFNNLEGDMARTIASPANSLRILRAQFTALQRSIGNIVSVFAAKLVPVVQAVVVAIRKLADSIAALLGYQLNWGDSSSSFGSSLGSSLGAIDDGASAVDNATGSMGSLGGATDKASKAAKELKRQLMGFDEINKLSDTSSGSSGGSGGSGGGGGSGGVGGGSTSLGIDPLQYDFLQGVTAATFDLSEAMKKLGEMTGWDFGPLSESLTRVTNALKPLAEIAKGALAWAWENVLKPLGKWTIEKGLPSLLNVFGASLELLAEVLKFMKPYAQWAWDNLFKPLAEWTADLFVRACNDATTAIEGLTDQFKNNPQGVENFVAGLGTVATVFGSLMIASKITGIFAKVAGVFGTVGAAAAILFESVKGGEGIMVGLKTVFSGTTGVIGKLKTVLGGLSKLFSPLNIVIALVVAAFVDLMLTSKDFRKTVGDAIQRVFDALKDTFSTIVGVIGKVVSSVGRLGKAIYAFYQESGLKDLVGWVLGKLVTLLSVGLSAALKVVSGIFKAVGKVLTAVIDNISDFFEGLTLVIKGIKKLDFGMIWKGLKKVVGSFAGIGKNMVLGILEGIGKALLSIGRWIKKHVFDKFFKAIKSAFGIASPAKKMKPIGDNIFKGILSGISGAVKGIGSWLKKHVVDKIVNGFKGLAKKAKKLKEAGKELFAKMQDGLKDKVKGAKTWLKEHVVDKISTGLKDKIAAAKDLATRGKELAGKVYNGISEGLSNAGTWVKDNIISPIGDAISNGKEKISEAIGNLTDGAQATVEAAVTLVQQGWTNVQSFVEALKGGDVNKAIGIIQDGWTNIKDWIDSHTGGAASKAIGLAKDTWDNVTGWIKENGWGAVPEKAIDLAKNGWTSLKDYLDANTGGEVSKAISVVTGTISSAAQKLLDWVDGEINQTVNVKMGTVDSKAAEVMGWVGESIAKTVNAVKGDINKEAEAVHKWGNTASNHKVGLTKNSENWSGTAENVHGWGNTGSKHTVALAKHSVTWSGTAENVHGWRNTGSKHTVALSKGRWSDSAYKAGNFKSKTATLSVNVKKGSVWNKAAYNVFGKLGGKLNATANLGVNLGRRASGGVWTAGSGWSPIQKFAAGGVPNEGQMFIAREAGPELVGTLGGSRNAVMNNDQIVSSVAYGVQQAVAGVARDVVNSLRGGGDSQPIIVSVTLDGKEVGRSAVTYHNDIVRSTGQSPLLV